MGHSSVDVAPGVMVPREIEARRLWPAPGNAGEGYRG